jgi:protein SCO1
MNPRHFTISLAYAAGRRFAAAALAFSLLLVAQQPSTAQTSPPREGSSVSFALTEANGRAITEQTYRGKWLVVYFGYTFCPDVCPTTLMEIAGALDLLGPRAREVQGLFISIDPKRDTPEVMSEYVKSFDPRLVGVTGTPAQIAAAAKSFHVFYERRDTDDGGYVYDHSAFISVVNLDGKFAKAFASESSSRQIADALTALMNARQ